jgi:ribosome-associated translation inhibitor RaiA
MKIQFKDLQTSEFVQNFIRAEINELIQKFPKIKNHRIEFLTSKNTSALGKKSDSYSTQLIINGKYYKKIFIKKYAKSVFDSVQEVMSLISSKLNSAGDRQRVIKIKAKRKFLSNTQQSSPFFDGMASD